MKRRSITTLAIFFGCTVLVSLRSEVQATEGSVYDNQGMSAGQDDRWKSSASIGAAMLEGKRYDVAIRYLTGALESATKSEDVAYLYGLRADAYLGKGESAKAAADYARAVNFVPKDAAGYITRGSTYKKMGRYKAAASDYARAIALSPDDDDALNSLAWLLATCPDGSVRDGVGAIRIGTKACELTRWKDSEVIDTLAAAYAETGKFDQAVKLQQQALQLRSVPAEDRPGMQERLASYQKRKPYRQAATKL